MDSFELDHGAKSGVSGTLFPEQVENGQAMTWVGRLHWSLWGQQKIAMGIVGSTLE